MNAELKRKWVEALRSGKYTQGPMRLRRAGEERFCCLGVLCDVAAPDQWWYNERVGSWQFGSAGDCHFAPAKLLDRDIQEKLSRMNDSENKTFAEIAFYIEHNIEES